MKFVFFSVSENGENGFGDEGNELMGKSPRFFGLEPPLDSDENMVIYPWPRPRLLSTQRPKNNNPDTRIGLVVVLCC